MSSQFGDLTASEIYCPQCNCTQPVDEHFLMATPEGELSEFLCNVCGTSVGKRTVSSPAVATTAATPAPAAPERRLLR